VNKEGERYCRGRQTESDAVGADGEGERYSRDGRRGERYNRGRQRGGKIQ
jgi:hypothetical protein